MLSDVKRREECEGEAEMNFHFNSKFTARRVIFLIPSRRFSMESESDKTNLTFPTTQRWHNVEQCQVTSYGSARLHCSPQREFRDRKPRTFTPKSTVSWQLGSSTKHLIMFAQPCIRLFITIREPSS